MSQNEISSEKSKRFRGGNKTEFSGIENGCQITWYEKTNTQLCSYKKDEGRNEKKKAGSR